MTFALAGCGSSSAWEPRVARTATVADMAAHEAAAKAGGGVIVWDLSHATGCVDFDLNAIGARLARPDTPVAVAYGEDYLEASWSEPPSYGSEASGFVHVVASSAAGFSPSQLLEAG